MGDGTHMKDIQLTRSFKRSEFMCPDCGKVLISDRLVRALQKLRDVVGVIIVNSGYRCPIHNAAIGGAKHSKHLLGLAADNVFLGCKLLDAYLAAMEIGAFTGVGIYPKWFDKKNKPRGNFLHLDVRFKPARWAEYQNKKIHFEEALDLLRKE